MECPKCLSPMKVIHHGGIEIDRCTACFGMFFDKLEAGQLKTVRGSKRIDIGDDMVGARFNEILDTSCPKCQVKMDTVARENPFPIRFESCPQCYGAYFDAGEFRDYLDDDTFEQLLDMVTERR